MLTSKPWQVFACFTRQVSGVDETGVSPKSGQVVIVDQSTKNTNASLPTFSPPVCLQTACRQPAKRLLVSKKRETGLEPATACLGSRYLEIHWLLDMQRL